MVNRPCHCRVGFRTRLGVGAPCAVLVLVFVGGCNTVAPPRAEDATSGSAPVVDDDPFAALYALPVPTDAVTTEHEPNDALSNAQTLPADSGTTRLIDGTLDSSADLDTFDVGTLQRGQRITLAVDSDVDGIRAVLLDDDERAVAIAKPFFDAAGKRSRGVAHVVRHDSDRGLIVVAAPVGSAFRGTSYQLRWQVAHAVKIPSRAPQRVVLNFGGADVVHFNDRELTDIPPFDAADIDQRYAGRTAEMVALIEAQVADSFAGLDVELVTRAGDGSPGPSVDNDETTVLHFGVPGVTVFGLAEDIDAYNSRRGEEALIYIEAFRQFLALSPTVQQMAAAIANVTSHELGHLLGLQHTAAQRSLMDITAATGFLLQPRRFGAWSLERGVSPVGVQDAALLLLDALSGDEAVFRASLSSAAEGDVGRPLPVTPGPPIDWAALTGRVSCCTSSSPTN